MDIQIFTANELIQLGKPHSRRPKGPTFDLQFDSFQLIKVSLGHAEPLTTTSGRQRWMPEAEAEAATKKTQCPLCAAKQKFQMFQRIVNALPLMEVRADNTAMWRLEFRRFWMLGMLPTVTSWPFVTNTIHLRILRLENGNINMLRRRS